ncbi:MAG: FG-GAP-like repeat-containing protein [Candidatus Thorarchaeota archaeon]
MTESLHSTPYTMAQDDLNPLWSYTTGDAIVSSPIIGDVDGDGRLEIIIGSQDHQVYALNGEDGTRLWSYTTGDWVDSSPALGDVDGDGKLEAIIGSRDGCLYALNGEDGTLLWSYDTSYWPISSAALGDVDDDGRLEVVIGSGNHAIYALDFPETHTAGRRAYWPSLGGNLANSRNIQDWDPDQGMLANNMETVIGTSPHNNDTDNDTLPDGWEVTYGLNPTNGSDATIDSDGDGLTNLEEYQHGSNPVLNEPMLVNVEWGTHHRCICRSILVLSTTEQDETFTR